MYHTLTDRQFYDLEMILNGGFSPLTGFLNQTDYQSVITDVRLQNGKVWPIPITLDVDQKSSQKLKIGDTLTLQDKYHYPIAYLEIESIYKPDKNLEAKLVFGSPDDTNHPAINYLLNQTEDYYIGGTVVKINDPLHFNFEEYRKTPEQLKSYFREKGIKNVIGFQTRNPMHRSHFELTQLALADVDDSFILIHPVVGMTKPGDIDYFTRIKCYKKLLNHYDGNAMLSLLPLAMRMAGPREALWHAIIRKNYGCTHFIVGRDHAGPGKNRDGEGFYDPYAAQQLVHKYKDEIGIEVLTYSAVGYVEELNQYTQINTLPKDHKYTIKNISGTELRRKLANDEPIPDWFTFPELIPILRKKGGVTVFFTGLSGSGKSTLANHLYNRLSEITQKPITILDGDEIRTHLSRGLTFSKEDRNENVKRIGYVSSLINKNGGISITSAISPYNESRQYCREVNQKWGRFVEVYVSTSLEKCEERDVKGLYKRARDGIIKNFTGISDPYEIPTNPEIIIDTDRDIQECITQIVEYIQNYI